VTTTNVEAATDVAGDAPSRRFDFETLEGGNLRLISSSPHGSAARAAEPERRVLQDHEFEELAPVTALMRREQTHRRWLAGADGLGALVTILIVARFRGQPFSWAFLACPLLAVLIAKVQGLYDRDDMTVRKSTLTEWRAVLRAAALTGVASYVLWYAVTDDLAKRGVRTIAALVLGNFLLTLPARAAARSLARRLSADARCLIVGTPHRCMELGSVVDATAGVELVGIVPDARLDCSVAGVSALVEELGVQRIIVGPHPGSSEEDVLTLIRSAKWLGVRVSLMPTLMSVVGAATTVDELDSIVLLGVPRFGLSPSSAVLKRTLDLVLGSLALLVLSPVMAMTALVIRLDSTGPALFRQRRIGREGRPFVICKFRSMVDDADQMKAALTDRNETAGLFKLKNDPRVTRVGSALRRTYLDELPQLFNVMKGEMSLVGPRPLVESEDALLTGYDRHRSRVTPGMTGPWQLRGPLNASLSELARLDYLYASNWSIWADIDILLGTAARVVSRHGH
jgi:exopolysaccharide biosynthesis polyprenyl glycosylphosphotransferase